MTAVLLEYIDSGETKQIAFDHRDAIRMIVMSRRKQAVAQLENRKYRQYALGKEYKEFSLTLDQTYDNVEKIEQLKSLRMKIKLYYKYNRYPSVYSVVLVNPNYTVTMAAGHLVPGSVQIQFIETPAV